MDESAHSINRKASILVSRNSPIALVVGVAGFLGSNLADELLEKNIQIVGIDDFSSGHKRNLAHAIKHKKFHLINESINNPKFAHDFEFLNLPRLDYAFFVADGESPARLLNEGLHHFLEFIKNIRDRVHETKEEVSREEEKGLEKPKIVLVSSINLYDNKLEHKDRLLKDAEVKFAKYVKHYKLNARVVRLAPVYGPRMHFNTEDPTLRLIQAALTDELQDQSSSLDFSSRSLYVGDVTALLIKSVLSGGTANKIYDGALSQPIKVSEIKQILLDPLWHEEKGFKPTELPPWYTPNLEKTIEELGWRPKTEIIEGLKKTISYFREHEIDVPKLGKGFLEGNVRGWSFKNYDGWENKENREGEAASTENFGELKEGPKVSKKRGFRKRLGGFIVLGIIMFGLVYPFGSLAVGGMMLTYHLKESRNALENGDFGKAKKEIQYAKNTLSESKDLLSSLEVLKRVGVLEAGISDLEQIVGTLDEGIDGVAHATEGSKALYDTTKIISGEDNAEPGPLYEKAQAELSLASQKINKVYAKISEESFAEKFPSFFRDRISDLSTKLFHYLDLVEKARVAAFLMPEVTALNGKKSYLVLLQNNLELRPTGGFIGSYGKFDFERGRLVNIKVDDIYALDGGLKDVIEPPPEIKNDLGVARWYLRDSNFDPDFPTSARQAEFFYKREAGEAVNGVIAIDLTGSGKLLSAVGGLDLPEYGEHVDGDNLFEKAISHAEVDFFPGSQEKKSYLVSLQTQLFNKVFYLSNQNWPAIIQALSENLEHKHMLIYLEDPTIFSYLASANWSGVFPRATESTEGQNSDFLAVNEANLGANKANYYLNRSYKLETSFGKEGQVNHKLRINYKNNSPSDVFPAGKYKNRIRIYLPLGAKINKAMWGENELSMGSFTDYGRSGVTVLLELMPKEQKTLLLDYNLGKNLTFKQNLAKYRLDVVKQAGTEQDPFDWVVTYPINFSLENTPDRSVSTEQELNIATDLLKDRSFVLEIQKK